MQGSLYLKLFVKAARMTRDIRSYGRMSPIALVRLGNLSGQTSKSPQTGKNPSWTEDFLIQANPDSGNLIIEIYDSNIEQKKFVASAQFNMAIAHSQPKFKQWITLRYKGKRVGDLLLEGGMCGESSTHSINLVPSSTGYGMQYSQPAYPQQATSSQRSANYMIPTQQVHQPPKVQMQSELEMGRVPASPYPAIPSYQPSSSSNVIPVGYQVSAPPSVLYQGYPQAGPGVFHPPPPQPAGSKQVYPQFSSGPVYSKLQDESDI